LNEAPVSPKAGYESGLAAGELRFQRCSCGKAIFYPRTFCPACGGSDLTWEVSAGEGTVYATTSMAVPGGQPYNVCLIDLDEGFRMMSRIDGIPSREAEIGARVRIAIVFEEGPVPAFRLADDRLK
jgi:uncharacterized protein